MFTLATHVVTRHIAANCNIHAIYVGDTYKYKPMSSLCLLSESKSRDHYSSGSSGSGSGSGGSGTPVRQRI